LPQDALQLWKHSAEQLKQFPTTYKHQWVETVKLVQAQQTQFRRTMSIRTKEHERFSHTNPAKTISPPESTTVAQPLGANQATTGNYKPSWDRSIKATIINELFIYLFIYLLVR